MPSVTAFAPATVSNVACGFDVLGFAMNAPGDEVTARLLGGRESFAVSASAGFTGSASASTQKLQTTPDPLVLIDDILGDHGRLPRDPAKNTASIAARALLTMLGERRGVALTIRKGLPLS